MSFTSPATIDTGNGGFPYELSASYTWHAMPPTQDGRFGTLIPGQPGPGWNSNWVNNLAISGSGMEAMGVSDLRAAAGTVAAFLTEQDIYRRNLPSAQRDVAAVLTQSWWVPQLSANVITVSLGSSSRQFVKLYSGTWIAPGPDYAALTVTGQRNVYQYMCPPPGASPHWPAEGPTYALSRGWDYSGMHFDVTNAHGDVQHFHFWLNIYSDDTTFVCRRNTGFRLDTWDFPQGVTVKIDYPLTTQTNSHTFLTSPTEGQSFPNSTVILGVENTVNRHLTFSNNQVSDGAGHTLLAPSYGDPTYTGSTTDPAGNVTSFALFAHPVATTRTQRPVPFQQLLAIGVRVLYAARRERGHEMRRAEARWNCDGTAPVQRRTLLRVSGTDQSMLRLETVGSSHDRHAARSGPALDRGELRE